MPGVLVEHLREADLELQGDAVPHHAIAVDGVDQGLVLAGKDVAGYDGG